MANVAATGTEQAGQATAVSEPTESGSDEALLGDELLVEEISIDGMCGVY